MEKLVLLMKKWTVLFLWTSLITPVWGADEDSIFDLIYLNSFATIFLHDSTLFAPVFLSIFISHCWAKWHTVSTKLASLPHSGSAYISSWGWQPCSKYIRIEAIHTRTQCPIPPGVQRAREERTLVSLSTLSSPLGDQRSAIIISPIK